MNSAGIASISEVVNRHIPQGDNPVTHAALVNDLVVREEALADVMRVAGQNFGLYPQIVTEVLAELEFGRPIDPAEREFIKMQFTDLMAQLQRQHEQGHE